MGTTTAKFAGGQLVPHRMFEYRGVTGDLDPGCHGRAGSGGGGLGRC